MSSKRIGYSCWGFLGSGIKDTPDGGRSHRALLVRGLINRGHSVIMLQRDRDSHEAKAPVRIGQSYDEAFPDIDVLFLEWRWPIPGQNTDASLPGYTPDLQRQRELLEHYSGSVDLIVWDKDQQLASSPYEDRDLLVRAGARVLEPSFYPSAPDRARALFPVDPLQLAVPAPRRYREIGLVYIGNKYDRDSEYIQYLAEASKYLNVHVYGKWSKIPVPSQVKHHGQIPFQEVSSIYRRSLATVLLAPYRYMRTGQFTQRIFESLSNGCIPFIPHEYSGTAFLTPPFGVVANGADLAMQVKALKALSPARWQEVLEAHLAKLEPFYLDHTLDAIESAINHQTPVFNDLSTSSEGLLKVVSVAGML